MAEALLSLNVTEGVLHSDNSMPTAQHDSVRAAQCRTVYAALRDSVPAAH